jgi:hypothetical protein
VVDVPGVQRPRTLVLGAMGLLGLAVLIIAGHLVLRRRVNRTSELPDTPHPSWEESRSRTTVS